MANTGTVAEMEEGGKAAASVPVEASAAKRLSFSDLSKEDEAELVKVYLRIRPDHQDRGGAEGEDEDEAYVEKETDAVKAISATTVQTIPPGRCISSLKIFDDLLW